MKINNYFMDLYTDKYGRKINEELAQILVNDLAVTDGSNRDSGQKFSLQEAKTIGEKVNVNWEDVPLTEYYLVLNMMYSDYFHTAKKYGYTDCSFFGSLAYDWFYDNDGDEDKTFNYFI